MKNNKMKMLKKELQNSSSNKSFLVISYNEIRNIIVKLKTDSRILFNLMKDRRKKRMEEIYRYITKEGNNNSPYMSLFQRSKQFLNLTFGINVDTIEIDNIPKQRILEGDKIGLSYNGEIYCYLLKGFSNKPIKICEEMELQNVNKDVIFADVNTFMELISDDDYLNKNITSINLLYDSDKKEENPKSFGSRCEFKKFIKNKRRKKDVTFIIETSEAVKAYFETLLILEE